MKPDLRHFPGDNGLPLIGHTLAFVANPRAMAADHYKRYGEVSRVNIAGNKGVLLLGPEANEFLTMDREKLFSSRAAYEPFLKDTFPDALGLFDFDEHVYQRRIMQSAFKKEAMVGYMSLLQDSAHQAIDGWKPGQKPFMFAPTVKVLLFNQAALLFMGESQDKEAEKLIAHYRRAAAGTVSLLRLNIPGTTFWKAVRSSLLLRQILLSKIPGKRANPGKDLFSHLCFATSEEGERFTDDQIVKHMLGLMSAAHETTTSAIVSMAYALAKHPEVQERVRAELGALGKTELAYEDLDALPYTSLVFQECLRLWGSSHTMPRKALRDVRFKDYTIPAGTMVFISPSFVHIMPQYWQDPERFDPERFSEERKEQRQHRYLYMPFGGGAHKCIGMHLAEMQVKIFFFNMLRKYRLSLPDPDYVMKTRYVPVPESADGLPLLLQPI